MAHAVQEAPPLARQGKARKASRRCAPPIGDIVALDIPPNRVLATFPVSVRVSDLPRMEPTVIFEPDDETE